MTSAVLDIASHNSVVACGRFALRWGLLALMYLALVDFVVMLVTNLSSVSLPNRIAGISVLFHECSRCWSLLTNLALIRLIHRTGQSSTKD
jgi:hypothetical protein